MPLRNVPRSALCARGRGLPVGRRVRGAANLPYSFNALGDDGGDDNTAPPVARTLPVRGSFSGPATTSPRDGRECDRGAGALPGVLRAVRRPLRTEDTIASGGPAATMPDDALDDTPVVRADANLPCSCMMLATRCSRVGVDVGGGAAAAAWLRPAPRRDRDPTCTPVDARRCACRRVDDFLGAERPPSAAGCRPRRPVTNGEPEPWWCLDGGATNALTAPRLLARGCKPATDQDGRVCDARLDKSGT